MLPEINLQSTNQVKEKSHGCKYFYMQYNDIMGGKRSIMTGRVNSIQVPHQAVSRRTFPKIQGIDHKLAGGKVNGNR